MTEEKKGKCGKLLVIAAIVIIILGISADTLGLGRDPGFGPKQFFLVAAGIVLLLLGLKSCKKCN